MPIGFRKNGSKLGFQKGDKANLGRKFTIEWRKNLSKSHKGKRAKENHPNWKGGVTPINEKIRRSLEYVLWREAVFTRDNWTCQKCLIRGGEIHPHHILNFSQYPELRFAIDNGITFCRNCHKLFHKIYGKQKNNKNQVIKFMFKSYAQTA